MKAEINNENKAKFFAQYWGQDILCSDMYGDGGTIYSATMKDSSIKDEWLELKSLSDISDEDAIEVARIFMRSWKYKEDLNIQVKKTRKVVDIIIDEDGTILKLWLDTGDIWGFDNSDDMVTTDFIWIYQYLISRGYLVPWMGLSCEELIEAGWVKYNKL